MTCRHHATFILPFYARLLAKETFVLKGKIHQLSVERVIRKALKRQFEGQVLYYKQKVPLKKE